MGPANSCPDTKSTVHGNCCSGGANFTLCKDYIVTKNHSSSPNLKSRIAAPCHGSRELCIDSNIFFEIKESKITRGHNYTLVKKQSRLDVRKYSFSQRTINVWNNLSTDCVHASSVNMLKNKIDKYLVKAGYT